MTSRRTAALAIAAVAVAAALAAAGLARGDRRGGDRVQGSLAVADALGGGDLAGFARADAPRPFTFPDDHGPHPGFRTEWWYYTGNLQAAGGRHLGFQLTFFRTALAAATARRESAWGTSEVYLAHFAVTDTRGGRFRAWSRTGRAALGLAGATGRPFRVWIDDWSVESAGPDGAPHAPARRGIRGRHRPRPDLGQAGRAPGRARPEPQGLRARQRVVLLLADADAGPRHRAHRRGDARGGGARVDGPRVEHERARPRSRGVGLVRPPARRWARPDALPAAPARWERRPVERRHTRGRRRRTRARSSATTCRWRRWARGPARGAACAIPRRWRLTVPAADLALDLAPRLSDQELSVGMRYWEGAVAVRGTAAGRPVAGHGYVELVGYGDRPPHEAVI